MSAYYSSRESKGMRREGPATSRREGPAALSKAHICPSVEWFSGASLMTISRGGTGVQVGGGKRGLVSGFSSQSRRRLLQLIGKVKRVSSLPYFLTLTYHNNFPDPRRAKLDLLVFKKRLLRAFPGLGVIWKLEPQQRGAPHFHLLIWNAEYVDVFPWVVENWNSIAAPGDELHKLFHLGQLKGSKPCMGVVRSWRGVWSYAAKYLGKPFEVYKNAAAAADVRSTPLPDENAENTGDFELWKWPGRFWGVWQPAQIPFGELVRLEIFELKAIMAMRYARRFMAGAGNRKNKKRRNLRTVNLFCDADQWAGNLFPAGLPP